MKRKLPKILFASRISLGGHKNTKPFAAHMTKGYFVFLLGIVIGSFLAVFNRQTSFLTESSVLSEILLRLVPFSFSGYWFQSFTIVMTAVVIVFVLGFTAAAVPVIYAVPGFRGIGFGVMMVDVYTAFNLRGLLICIVGVIPFALLTVAAICILSMDAVIISRGLTLYIFKEDITVVKKSRVKVYFVKFIISSVTSAFAALIHAVGVKLLLFVF